MIINSVLMKNFRSHAETLVEFGPGINVILGENGAGKTSILEAISFGLFKEYGGNIDRLVRSGHREMSVEVVFTGHGRKYKVVRRRTKSSTESRLLLLDGREKEIRSGDTGVDEEIASILGIDKYIFSNAIYVRQGEIERLLTETAHRKKQLIARLLGIEALEKVWESMRPLAERYRERKAVVEGEIMREDELKGQKEEMMKELSEVRDRMAKTRKAVDEKSAELRKLEADVKRLAEVEKRHEGMSVRRDELSPAISRENERLAALRRKLAETEKYRKESESIKGRLPRGWKADTDRKIDVLRTELSDIDTREGSLKGRLADLREWDGKLEGAGRRCPLCGSELTESHRRQIIMERRLKIRGLEKEAARLASKKAAAKAGLERLTERRDEISGLEKRQTELSGALSGYDETLDSIKRGEKEIVEMNTRLAALDKEMKGIDADMNAYVELKPRLAALRSELEALRGAHDRQEGRLQALSESMERLEKESRAMKEKKGEQARLAEFIKTLTEIRSLFDKSGLQLDLRKRSVPVIEGHIREFFREFNFEYSDISLDENYDVTLYGPGGESTTDMMSGGERIAAALALRLGIARSLAGSSAETVMLDEPTIFLDEQRRHDLIEVLKKTSVIPQMIVVTHDTAMEDAADSVTVIKKSRGVSSAE